MMTSTGGVRFKMRRWPVLGCLRRFTIVSSAYLHEPGGMPEKALRCKVMSTAVGSIIREKREARRRALPPQYHPAAPP
jgi:hypothetical protein